MLDVIAPLSIVDHLPRTESRDGLSIFIHGYTFPLLEKLTLMPHDGSWKTRMIVTKGNKQINGYHSMLLRRYLCFPPRI